MTAWCGGGLEEAVETQKVSWHGEVPTSNVTGWRSATSTDCSSWSQRSLWWVSSLLPRHCSYVDVVVSHTALTTRQVPPRLRHNQWRREGGRGRAASPGGTLQGAAFVGRKLGILAFALQCVSVSLYLFLIYSAYWEWVLPVGGAAKTPTPPLVIIGLELD